MEAASSVTRTLWARQNPSDTNGIFLNLVSDPYKSSFSVNSFWFSFGTSIGITALLAIVFCVYRPWNNTVYAPRLRYIEDKYAPPVLDKGLLSWLRPVRQLKEHELVDLIGMDATIFLRFTRMCRNMFLVMSVFGCLVMIPVNVTKSVKFANQNAFTMMTPQFLWGEALWAHVVCAWLIDIIIVGFLWHNYRAVVRLRQNFFKSPAYQAALSSRTLMVTDIPEPKRSNEGIAQLIDEVGSIPAVPHAVIARNVRELPKLVKQHESAVRELESVLAKYLKDPNRLPSRRPTCKPQKEDKSYSQHHKVDAIEYYATRIKELEEQIKEVRRHIDKRDPISYGFASFDSITIAHTIAHAARGKHPQGSSIRLAPRPRDIIWENLQLSKKTKRKRAIINNIWVVLLTVVWIVPNALIAVFLSNLSNLGLVWPAFQTNLNGHPKLWAAVQGILAPLLLTLVYIWLPSVFRKLSIRAGDRTKASREKHVTHKLYSFFVFNNLIVFTFFSTIWGLAAQLISIAKNKENFFEEIKNHNYPNVITLTLCQVSTFWVTWILQRNLGAAIDLVQAANLFLVWFGKTFMSLTPRQLIEWTAPPPFDYASYYNYFLFYATVAICFATLQPIILPITAVYFALDAWLKKYLLLYVFRTKNESGGEFWIIVFNRLLFAAFLANILVGLVVLNRGGRVMACVILPLLVLLLAFKWFCKRTFDDKVHYTDISKEAESLEAVVGKKHRRDKTGIRFGHPVLSRPLLTPMVLPQARPLLEQIYKGRTTTDEPEDTGYVGMDDGFRSINLQAMSSTKPGKHLRSQPSMSTPFEVVEEGDLDFANFKNRADFGDYGHDSGYRDADNQSIRSSIAHSRAGSSDSSPTSSRSGSPAPQPFSQYPPPGSSSSRVPFNNAAPASGPAGVEPGGVLYPPSYHHPAGMMGRRPESPLAMGRMASFESSTGHDGGPMYTVPSAADSEARLLRNVPSNQGRDMYSDRR